MAIRKRDYHLKLQSIEHDIWSSEHNIIKYILLKIKLQEHSESPAIILEYKYAYSSSPKSINTG